MFIDSFLLLIFGASFWSYKIPKPLKLLNQCRLHPKTKRPKAFAVLSWICCPSLKTREFGFCGVSSFALIFCIIEVAPFLWLSCWYSRFPSVLTDGYKWVLCISHSLLKFCWCHSWTDKHYESAGNVLTSLCSISHTLWNVRSGFSSEWNTSKNNSNLSITCSVYSRHHNKKQAFFPPTASSDI